jgi:hypothetical protein
MGTGRGRDTSEDTGNGAQKGLLTAKGVKPVKEPGYHLDATVGFTCR